MSNTETLGKTLTFLLPEGWSTRKVATALAREWLEPFRPEVKKKSDRWTLQPVVEKPEGWPPLWEEGISTEEYERRLENPDLGWSVRAKTGRFRTLVLAQLTTNTERKDTFDLACYQDDLPATLIDPELMADFLKTQDAKGVEGLITGLLFDQGFELAAAN